VMTLQRWVRRSIEHASGVEQAAEKPPRGGILKPLKPCPLTKRGARLGRAAVTTLALTLACGGGLARAQALKSNPGQPSGKWQDVSLEEYRAHLRQLETLTEACAKGRDLASCDPTLVGKDDRVPWNAGAQPERRLVRYGWLRLLFSQAEEPDQAVKAANDSQPSTQPSSTSASPFGSQSGSKSGSPSGSASPKPEDESANSDVLSTSQLLKDAEERLAGDLEQANQTPGAAASHTNERAVLKDVLAGPEFRNLKQPDGRESALEKVGNWLNKLFEGLGRLQVRSAWVGRVLIWGFLLAVGVGLAWALLQLERRWRVRLVPEGEAPASGAASARDWQLWLKDAREAAARRKWREAIHFLYWAAISRLESKKLWPADRARTPREYLALVAGEDPRNAGLGALTREFEWTWYGGRDAFESDYRRAEELAQGLLEGASATAPAGTQGSQR